MNSILLLNSKNNFSLNLKSKGILSISLNPYKIKNSFIDFKIKFYFDLFFKYSILEEEISNISSIFQFSKKLINQKQEIKLNNFLKINLNQNQKKEEENKIKKEIIGCGIYHSFIFNGFLIFIFLFFLFFYFFFLFYFFFFRKRK